MPLPLMLVLIVTHKEKHSTRRWHRDNYMRDSSIVRRTCSEALCHCLCCLPRNLITGKSIPDAVGTAITAPDIDPQILNFNCVEASRHQNLLYWPDSCSRRIGPQMIAAAMYIRWSIIASAADVGVVASANVSAYLYAGQCVSDMLAARTALAPVMWRGSSEITRRHT